MEAAWDQSKVAGLEVPFFKTPLCPQTQKPRIVSNIFEIHTWYMCSTATGSEEAHILTTSITIP